jgi:hypothetical protein
VQGEYLLAANKGFKIVDPRYPFLVVCLNESKKFVEEIPQQKRLHRKTGGVPDIEVIWNLQDGEPE